MSQIKSQFDRLQSELHEAYSKKAALSRELDKTHDDINALLTRIYGPVVFDPMGELPIEHIEPYIIDNMGDLQKEPDFPYVFDNMGDLQIEQ